MCHTLQLVVLEGTFVNPYEEKKSGDNYYFGGMFYPTLVLARPFLQDQSFDWPIWCREWNVYSSPIDLIYIVTRGRAGRLTSQVLLRWPPGMQTDYLWILSRDRGPKDNIVSALWLRVRGATPRTGEPTDAGLNFYPWPGLRLCRTALVCHLLGREG